MTSFNLNYELYLRYDQQVRHKVDSPKQTNGEGDTFSLLLIWKISPILLDYLELWESP